MRQSRVSCPTVGGNDRCDMASRIVDLLRKRYPTKTAECVACDLQIKSCTAQKWVDRSSAPSAWLLLRMVNAYGPEFLAVVMGDMAPAWLREDAHAARRDEIKSKMAALEAELQSL